MSRRRWVCLAVLHQRRLKPGCVGDVRPPVRLRLQP